MSVVLVARFKNEAHIMYEFINHYLLEGVDHFILIDDNSNDDYLEKNKWLFILINAKVVEIHKSAGDQLFDANRFLQEIKRYNWIISCDLDEFFFSVGKGTRLKGVLNRKCADVDYIQVYWKLFTHNSKIQPISVIENNVHTHASNTDVSSPRVGNMKCIARTEFIKYFWVHMIEFNKNIEILKLGNCHNNLIQLNHYRTQSDEFLYGVKEQRGGGIVKQKYKNFQNHKKFEYNKICCRLKNKRASLIEQLHKTTQVRPKIHKDSSLVKENVEKENVEKRN